jgi:RhtB (resistance to homoserine/threonine) family protein
MEYLPLIGTVAILNLLAVISPGPDFVITVKNSIRYSRRSGIYTSLGIGLGLCIHLSYCAAGIGFIISKSIILFSIIKFLGAGYLIYIGISSILSKGQKPEITEEKTGDDLTRWQAFRTGFFTNVLNPKVTLFILSLFTLVIGPATPAYVILIISIIIILTAITWFTIVSIFFTQISVQRVFYKFENTINRFLGGLLVLLGIKIALSLR